MTIATRGERWPIWLLLAVFFLGLSVSAEAQIDDDDFRAVVAELVDANFREKTSLAELLLESGHPGAPNVLTALMEGRLFIRDQDTQVFVIESTSDDLLEFVLLDPVSRETVGSSSPDQLSRIITNNQLRRFLRTAVPRFSLSSPDNEIRLEAVRQLSSHSRQRHRPLTLACSSDHPREKIRNGRAPRPFAQITVVRLLGYR